MEKLKQENSRKLSTTNKNWNRTEVDIQCESKKPCHSSLRHNFGNVGRFSKFFHC